MKGAIAICSSGRVSKCTRCGICCSSISGTKAIPPADKLGDTEFLTNATRSKLNLATDCPYLTPEGSCGVFPIRQKFPNAFPDCTHFSGQTGGFVWKLCTSILNPSDTELDTISKAGKKGIFVGMNGSFEAHFTQFESIYTIWNKCCALIGRMLNLNWDDAAISLYFSQTHLLSYLQKNIHYVKVTMLFQTLVFGVEPTSLHLLKILTK